MGNEMAQKEQDDRVTLSVADVKDSHRLMHEMEGFANALLQTALQHDDTRGAFVLTFDHESGMGLALTIYQLLALVRTVDRN